MAAYDFGADSFPVKRVDRATGRSKEVPMSITFKIEVEYNRDVVTEIEAYYQVFSNERTAPGH
jgi:hypothetical protein